MVQILRRTPYKSTSDYVAEAFGALGESQGRESANRLRGEQAEALKSAGIDPNLPPELQKVALSESLKGKRQEDKFSKIADLFSDKSEEPSKKTNSIYEPEEEIESPKKKSFKVSDVPKEKRAQFALIDPQASKALEHMADVEEREKSAEERESRRQFESDRDYHSKRSDPIIKEAQNVIDEARTSKALSAQARRAVESGNVSGIIPYLTAKFQYEPGVHPDTAILTTAQKHSFLGDLKGVAAGARPNQFLERIMTSAQPQVGRSEEANLDILDIEDFIRDMNVKKAELKLQLADKDLAEHKYAKADISRRADQIMDDYAEEAQDKLAYSIRNRHVSNLSDEQLAREMAENRVVTDQPLTQREAKFIYLKHGGDMKAANLEIRKKGYKIPKKSSYEAR